MTTDSALPEVSRRPIGVFDSGVGGLSVLRALRRELPGEHFVYYADSAHCPYGGLDDEQIRTLTFRAVRTLAVHPTKAAIIACNTASAFSLDALRAWAGNAYPIVGLVPALKPAVQRTRSGVVGVLATPGTLRGTLLADVIERVARPAGVRVMTAVSEKLVPLVEAGQWNAPETRAELCRVLAPIAREGADQLVLGCTHYPFLREAIMAEFASHFSLLDSAEAVARQTRRVLAEQHALRENHECGEVRAFTSGDPALVGPVASRLFGEALSVEPASALPGAA
ncbi:glutamate racemase [Deinococcus peraridilitoris]|uniref:Glutamate racemase n=1 Tax=Deinococcus peraridilitoris (strain DSM 19664 / LMG 22246 / CIP 109416 / KR-200) TaxID=937777 RepID=L0A739_DEIPD|nr:glutamate racemase [Deinococcus peraridilitoris]AFZ68870.1 glutamate racemase [Deinococcus peraridilitoris DSM 19664]